MNCACDFFCFDRNDHYRHLMVCDARIAHHLDLIDPVNAFDDGTDFCGKCKAPCGEVLARRNEEIRVEGIVHPFPDRTVERVCEATETDHHRQRKHQCRHGCGSPSRCFDETIGGE